MRKWGIVIDRKHFIKYWRFFSIAPAQDNGKWGFLGCIRDIVLF